MLSFCPPSPSIFHTLIGFLAPFSRISPVPMPVKTPLNSFSSLLVPGFCALRDRPTITSEQKRSRKVLMKFFIAMARWMEKSSARWLSNGKTRCQRPREQAICSFSEKQRPSTRAGRQPICGVYLAKIAHHFKPDYPLQAWRSGETHNPPSNARRALA